jgi:hypothetical protein
VVVGVERHRRDNALALVGKEIRGDGDVEPVIHAVRSLEEVPASIQELIDRKVVGKTVIRIR